MCRDVWTQVFGAPVSRLQRNVKLGMFVIGMENFPWTLALSELPGTDRQVEASHLLVLPCGIIRGALACLGAEGTVAADVKDLPNCAWPPRVRIPGPRSRDNACPAGTFLFTIKGDRAV